MLLEVYNTIGKVSLENCKFLYNKISNKDYQKKVDNVFGYLSKPLYTLLQPIYYTIAYMHAPYMLEKYKENPKFINKIKYLTENLAKLEINDFFEIIDLTTNQGKNQEIVSPYLDKYKKECEEAYDKQRRLVK